VNFFNSNKQITPYLFDKVIHILQKSPFVDENSLPWGDSAHKIIHILRKSPFVDENSLP